MAGKRLTAFVVDVGPGMREREPGADLGDPTPLEKTVSDLATVLQRSGSRTRRHVSDLAKGWPTEAKLILKEAHFSCFRKIFSEEGKAASTRSEVCLVLFGTDETENPLADNDPDYYR